MEPARAETTDSSNAKAKLFVGQIPREMTEEHLREFFEPFGSLREVSVIRDPLSGISRGCAFVIYHERISAQNALDNLHNTLQLPNASNPLQVRFAETPLDRENKLFVGMLPKTFTENDLVDMFSPFGEIKEIHIIRGPDGSPKGCAFVKFIEKDGASSAIDALNETIPAGATRPLVVKFAESKRQIVKSEGTPSRNDLLAAKQPINFQSNIQPAPQQSQLSHYDLRPATLMHPYAHLPSAPQTHSSSSFGGSPIPPMSAYPFQGTMVMQSPQIPLGTSSLASAASQSPHLRPPEGPDGANLFIYHLPRDITDADLATLFAPFGNVISAKVFVDKKTSDSKGFGFVSYDSFDSANNAIESMNGFQIGSKRLKVQHKRVGSSLWGAEEPLPHQRSSMGRPERGPPPPFSQFRQSVEHTYPSSNFAQPHLHNVAQGPYGSGYGLPHSTTERY